MLMDMLSFSFGSPSSGVSNPANTGFYSRLPMWVAFFVRLTE